MRISLDEFRSGPLACCGELLKVGTWNVEHLAEVKIVELQRIMIERDIGILCLQETHSNGVDSFVTEEGFFIILSGGPVGERNYVGVGFLIAPAARRFVIIFNQYSDRIASLKIRVRGG